MMIRQIVPRIKPGLCGVGDYALALARQLRGAHGIDSSFICGCPDWRGPNLVDGFHIASAGASRTTLTHELNKHPVAPVFLNYVAPGYNRNSCPFWLKSGVANWKQNSGTAPLITIFHEFYSVGPPWTRSFWTNPMQRHIGAAVARMSDRILVTTKGVQERLETMVPTRRAHIGRLEIFSNVGEIGRGVVASDREPWLVIFGSPGWRSKAYVEFRESLELACSLYGVTRIIDLGAPLPFSPNTSVPLFAAGQLDAAEVSAWMMRCRFALSTYSQDLLGKSGIFAAYTAHGCIPLLPPNCRSVQDKDVPVVVVGDPLVPTDLDQMQQRVVDWYQPHSLVRHAEEVARQLEKISSNVRN